MYLRLAALLLLRYPNLADMSLPVGLLFCPMRPPIAQPARQVSASWVTILPDEAPDGVTGRRAELKLLCRKTCGFESRSGDMCECGKPVFVKKTGECKTCYHRRYYVEQRRPRLLAYLGGRCAVCGATEDLQFDHIDPTLKSFEINANLTLNAEVKAELDKCQLLCEPHHLEKTSREHSGFTHGTVYAWMKAKCECDECSSAKRGWNDSRNEKRRATAAPRGPRGPYEKDPAHGTTKRYRRGCRCTPCRGANSQKARDYRHP